MLRYLAKSAVFGADCLTGRPRATRRAASNCLTIFTYHSFCDGRANGSFNSIPTQRFNAQLRFLRKNFELVSLAQGLQALQSPHGPGRPMAAITIDDGFRDNYHSAWPLLHEYRIPAAIFVATDFIDTGRLPWPGRAIAILQTARATHVEHPFHAPIDSHTALMHAAENLKRTWRCRTPPARERALATLASDLGVREPHAPSALTWQQLREMHAAGIEIGSHTVFHSILTEMPPEVLQQELVDSKARIEEQLQAPCRFLAYPNGDHDADVESAARACGYGAALSQDFGSNGCATPRMALRRVEVPFDNPLPYFSVRASRALASLSGTVP